jgi:hypothetical protein
MNALVSTTILLGHDPSERFDVAAATREALGDIRQPTAAHRQALEPAKNQRLIAVGPVSSMIRP